MGRLTDRALSCEPQHLRGPTEAPECDAKTVSRIDWNALWLVSCSALLGRRPGFARCARQPSKSNLHDEVVPELDQPKVDTAQPGPGVDRIEEYRFA